MSLRNISSYDYQNIEDALAEEYGFRPQTIKLEEFLAKGKVLDPIF